MKAIYIPSILLIAVSLADPSFAQQAIAPYVVASGGGAQGGSNYVMLATVGQPIAGRTNGLLAGFWQTLDASTLTSIEEGPSGPSVPSSFRLLQNYPNPFNPTTTIVFELPSASDVSITIVDALGRLVSKRELGSKPAGVHTVIWNGRDNTGALAPSGTYWYRVEAGKESSSRMMVLLK